VLWSSTRSLLLTWDLHLQAYFDAPGGKEPLALDLESMGKGQVWINNQSIGRYWMAYAKGDCNSCTYSGAFRPVKCQLGCGQPTQRWYCFSVKVSLAFCYCLEPLNLYSLTNKCHVQSERIVRGLYHFVCLPLVVSVSLPSNTSNDNGTTFFL